MDTDDAALGLLARRLGAALAERGWRVATAESCTGGWIAKCLTDIPGSSGWFEGGCVTYSNAAKTQLLGVPGELIASAGAVSRAVVEAMAAGVRERTGAAVAVAVSGIAGPGGGTADKPVGTVCFAWTGPGAARAHREARFDGDRDAVRRQAIAVALRGLLEQLERG